jgi:hypothetical protein
VFFVPLSGYLVRCLAVQHGLNKGTPGLVPVEYGTAELIHSPIPAPGTLSRCPCRPELHYARCTRGHRQSSSLSAQPPPARSSPMCRLVTRVHTAAVTGVQSGIHPAPLEHCPQVEAAHENAKDTDNFLVICIAS